MNTNPETLDQYLALEYPFNVVADPDGGYVILFPDLPGCMTQVEGLDDVGPMADEIRTLWIETEYERGAQIPLPSYPEEYSGKFVLRVPRSLHRDLAESAKREGVSLNQYVAVLMARRDAQARIERRLDEFGQHETGTLASSRRTEKRRPSAARSGGARKNEARALAASEGSAATV